MGRGKNKADFPMDHFDNNFRIRFSDAGSVSEPGIESGYACQPKMDLFWIASPRRHDDLNGDQHIKQRTPCFLFRGSF